MTEYFEYGYWGLFFASFLAATILPFSSEALLVLMIASGYDYYKCLLLATIGNWLGGMSGYFLGYLGKWEWIEHFLKIRQEKLNNTKRWLDKYGNLLAFLCWLPVIGDLLAVGLGLIRSNPWLVSVYMFTGKLLRYIALGYFTLWGKDFLS